MNDQREQPTAGPARADIELGRASDPEQPRPDVVDFGSTGSARAGRSRRRFAVAAALVVAVLVGALVYSQTGASAPRRAAVSPSGAGSSRPGSPSDRVPPSTVARGTTALPGPVPGFSAGWELYVRSALDVVRIQLAAGKITDTQVPLLRGNGPVMFLPTPDGVLAEPAVPGGGGGYLVPDGKPSQPIHGLLNGAGQVFSGPTPGTFWVADQPTVQRLALVDADGAQLGGAVPTVMDLPEGNSGTVVADGTGYVLLIGNGGVYDLRPGTSKRIATGGLIAVGPTVWLVQDCDTRGSCLPYTVDSRTGARRQVNVADTSHSTVTGLVSPDGRTAAVIDTSAVPPRLTLENLVDNGYSDANPVPVVLGPADAGCQLVWSPDGKWLLVMDSVGRLHAVEAATHDDRLLALPIPAAIQLAVRSAAAP